MEIEELQEIEKEHYKVQLGVFFTRQKDIRGATLFWNDQITDFYWNYANLVDAEQHDVLIENIIDYYEARNRKPAINVTPWTKSKGLEQRLRALGFSVKYQQSWQIYKGEPVESLANRDIREVKTADEMQTFVRTFEKAFSGAPGDPYGHLPKTYGETVLLSFGKRFWQNYLVFDKEKPVATGGIAIDGKYAGIYSVGTDPSFRRKGAGTDIVKFLTKKALENNCEVIFLQTMRNSYNEQFYNNLGFKTEFIGNRWVRA